MISKYFFRAREIGRRLWVRTALITALAFVAPLLAPLIAGVLPASFLSALNVEQVRSLLDILANSMLAVTTFSLTVMVTAHLAADRSASPRGHRMLREDGRTQTVLATFVGSFVFATVSIVVLQTGFLGQESTGAYYLMTLVVFAIVIVTILRWIGHLSTLGSVEATIATAQEKARQALETRSETPFLGAHRLDVSRIPDGAHTLASPRGGYVRHVDTPKLSSLIAERAGEVYVTAQPGSFVGHGDPLAFVRLEPFNEEDETALSACFTLGESRSFDQDPVFAISVLTDIAERALSPGINDPRTALDVCARLRLLLDNFEGERELQDSQLPGVFAPGLDLLELIQTAFESIARDGQSNVDVQIHVQAALEALTRHRSKEVADAARLVSGRALAYAETGLVLAADLARVKAIAPVPRAETTAISE